MKQIDNRQKQQIQLRAEKMRIGKHIHDTKEEGAAPAGHEHGGDQENSSHERLEPYHADPKIGRNDLCPCGSGKKYKKCCLNK